MDRVPKYAKPAVDPPKIREDALVPIDKIEFTDVDGEYGPQYQVDGRVRGTDFNARAWIKKYDDPTVKTKIVKLCMLVEDELNTEFDSIDEAIYALTTKIGCLHFKCSGHRKSEDGPDYPKFTVNTGSFPTYDKPAKPDNTVARIDGVRAKVLAARPNITETDLDNMVSDEVAKAGGLLTEEAATYLVSQSLGVDIAG